MSRLLGHEQTLFRNAICGAGQLQGACRRPSVAVRCTTLKKILMADTPYPTLAHAPVIEAVIELKVRTTEPVGIERLEPLKSMLKGRFPVSKELHFFQAEVRIDADHKAEQNLQAMPSGVRLDTNDNKYVAQCRVDGVAISRLTPYVRWDSLCDVAKEVWTAYVETISPAAVTRLGVRYINRITLDAESIDFDALLTSGPRIPTGMPQELTEFFNRVVVPLPKIHSTVAIVQALDAAPPVHSGSSLPGLILDIDAFCEEAHPVGGSRIWETLELLRGAKNLAFFSSITEQTLERFK
jgi:uncharacterized protein (TIGR04255 family)